jgi:hypothetical protein
MREQRAILLASLLLGACASYGPPPAADVPGKLKAAAGETLLAVLPAKGVQIYECRPKGDAAGAYDWAFVAPEARLFDGSGKEVGKHYGGPTWEAYDGSKVVGTVMAKADAPGAHDIAWLLLSTRQTGKDGGMFSKVTSIQRLHTAGGTAPPGGCTSVMNGAKARINYTADYYLYGSQ